MQKHVTLALLATGFLTAAVPASRASVTTSGNFQTGTPMPTLNLTTPITFNITTTGSFALLAFDEWVTSDGSANTIGSSPAGQTLSYRINNGTVLTVGVNVLLDNLASTAGALTANDGYLGLASAISVTAGQTVTFLPGSLTFGNGGSFNPPPTLFNGNAFLASGNGTGVSGLASVNAVPEPSTWGMLGVGVAGLGIVTLRRCRVA